jgi:hypothetical protein
VADFFCDNDSQVLEGNGSDKLSALLKTAVWCLTSPEKHFAEVTPKTSRDSAIIYELHLL